MQVTINLTKKEIEHLKYCNAHYDSCGYVSKIIEKIKRSPKLTGYKKAKEGLKKLRKFRPTTW